MAGIFCERGAPSELLMDNSTSFRSHQMEELCQQWGVRRRFRAAYYPEGNGIVERHHRTIKRTAARARISPMMAVHLYNAAPLVGEKSDSCPAHLLHQYKWTSKLGSVIELSLEPPEGPFHVGQAVMVRPNGAQCTSSWNDGTVTGLISEWTI